MLQISTEQLQIKSNQYDGYILIKTITYSLGLLQINTGQLQIKSNQYDSYILIRTVTN